MANAKVTVDAPDRIRVGASVIMWDVGATARLFGVAPEAMEKILAQFEIPVLTFPGNDKRYFSQYSLEIALFQLGLPPALRGAASLGRAHHEIAGLLYGHSAKEAIIQHVSDLARNLREGSLTKDRTLNTITRDKRPTRVRRERRILKGKE